MVEHEVRIGGQRRGAGEHAIRAAVAELEGAGVDGHVAGVGGVIPGELKDARADLGEISAGERIAAGKFGGRAVDVDALRTGERDRPVEMICWLPTVVSVFCRLIAELRWIAEPAEMTPSEPPDEPNCNVLTLSVELLRMTPAGLVLSPTISVPPVPLIVELVTRNA